MRRRTSDEEDAPPEVRLGLLGGFELSVDGAPADLGLSGQRLLVFLSLRERPVHRAFVAESLWLDHPQAQALASLRTALWRVRSLGAPLIADHRGRLALDDGVLVDVRAATAAAKRALAGRATEADAAVLTAADDVLPDWYDDWLGLERERFRQLRLHALEALCLRLLAEGRYATAVEVGVSLVAGEPLRESAHRLTIQAHLASGNRAEALRQYDLYVQRVRALGLAPSAAIARDLERAHSAGAAMLRRS